MGSKHDFVFNEAEAMVPLIRRILADLSGAYASVLRLKRQVHSLRANRTATDYRARRQFYDAQAELGQQEQRLTSATRELDDLGVVVLDPVRGMCGFPFLWSPTAGSKRVRRALFLLKLADSAGKGIHQWRFLGETTEHTVPSHWSAEPAAPAPADEQPAKSNSSSAS